MRKTETWNEDLLREAVGMAVRREMRELDGDMQDCHYSFSPQFRQKMQNVLQGTSLKGRGERDDSFLESLSRYRTKKKSGHVLSWGRYALAAVLLMALASAAALASEDVREGLRKLNIEFGSNGVSIEGKKDAGGTAGVGNDSGGTDNGILQGDSSQTGAGAGTGGQTEEKAPFHAYKWEKIPEGYHVVNETEEPEGRMYTVWYQDKDENNLHFMQHDASVYTVTITCNEEEGYRQTIDLNGVEAYSISDGISNSIFFEKDGYIFTVMSEQPEDIMAGWIKNSGILQE